MSFELFIIFILTIIHSILFYSKALGLNTIIFTMFLLIFIVWTLKKNVLIKNKKALLLIIPILILSATYFIYDNELFRVLNVFVIPLLIITMYIYTVKPANRLSHYIKDILLFIFEPLNNIGKVFNLVSIKLNSIFKLSKENKKKVISILIVLPITILVLILLSKADMMFARLMNTIFKIFENIKLENVIGRAISIFILFIYLGAVINYLLFNYENKKNIEVKKKDFEPFTIRLLLTVLNIIYIVFAIIQVRSLVFHKVSESIDYAKYARTGFFWLLVISIINLIILLYSKRAKNEKNDKYIKAMSTLMLLLTIVVIASSFVRMYMYQDFYGYTTLRLLVYAVLITEVVLLIPTLIYIYNSKINIFKSYLTIIIVSYAIVNLIPFNSLIAKNNIKRYHETNKIDLDYLRNYSADNVPYLTELYDNLRPEDTEKYTTFDGKDELNWYLYELDFNTKDFREYNISKRKASKALEEFKKTHKEKDYALE